MVQEKITTSNAHEQIQGALEDQTPGLILLEFRKPSARRLHRLIGLAIDSTLESDTKLSISFATRPVQYTPYKPIRVNVPPITTVTIQGNLIALFVKETDVMNQIWRPNKYNSMSEDAHNNRHYPLSIELEAMLLEAGQLISSP